MKISRTSKAILWSSLAGLVVVTGASAAGTFNNAEVGYTICVDNKTKMVTYPGTEKCKSGQKKLLLGAKGLTGDAGVTGAAGLPGPAGAAGAAGAAVAVGATGPSGPSVIWISPVELVHPGMAVQSPNVTLASVDVPVPDGGFYKQFVAKIGKYDGSWNMVQATVAIPESWRKSGNVYATVYWAAEKIDGKINMAIGYGGLTVGEIPTTTGRQEFCANSSPTKANIIQTCSKKISDLIYPNDEMSFISLKRYEQIEAVDSQKLNTGDLYIYGIKLEQRN